MLNEDANSSQIQHACEQCGVRKLYRVLGRKEYNGERELLDEATVLQYRLQKLHSLYELESN